MLNQAFIEQLKAAWREDTGKDISNQDAWDMATRAFCFFEALLRSGVRSVDNPSLTEPKG